MTLVNGYCTVSDVRDQISDTSGLVDVDLIDRAINATSRAIDRYCARKFWQDALVTTREYNPDDDRVAWVDDISTTTGLIIKTDTTGAGAYATTWASTDYVLEPRNANVAASGDTITPYAYWRIVAIDRYLFIPSEFRSTLQVTAKFGWSSIPYDVTAAAVLKAVALLERKNAPFGVAGFSEWGVVRIGRRDPEVMDLLAPYRRLTVGAI